MPTPVPISMSKLMIVDGEAELEKEKIDRQTHRWKDKISKAIMSIK